MKRAELIIGKAYYYSTEAGWRNYSSRGADTYCKTSQKRQENRVVVVETQLKTEFERKHMTREVKVRRFNGREEWVPLVNIRTTWSEAIRLLTQDYRSANPSDTRDQNYRKHLKRKFDREVFNPAYKQMINSLKDIAYLYEWETIQKGLTIDHINAINAGLALLKTQESKVA